MLGLVYNKDEMAADDMGWVKMGQGKGNFGSAGPKKNKNSPRRVLGGVTFLL